MPDIIGDPAFVCLGLGSAEDELIVISLKLRLLSCCGVIGNLLFPGSAVKYLENISHSFSSSELLVCTPLTSLVSNKGFITVPCLLNSLTSCFACTKLSMSSSNQPHP